MCCLSWLQLPGQSDIQLHEVHHRWPCAGPRSLDQLKVGELVARNMPQHAATTTSQPDGDETQRESDAKVDSGHPGAVRRARPAKRSSLLAVTSESDILALPRRAARSFDAFLAAQVFRRRWSAEPDREFHLLTCHGVNVTTKLGRKDSSAGSEASRIVKDCRQKTPEIRGKPSPGRSAPERRSLAELGVHHVHPCQRNSKNGCKVRLVNVDSNQGHRTQDS